MAKRTKPVVELVGAIRRYGLACEELALAIQRDRPTTKKESSLRVEARRLCRILGVRPTDQQLCELTGLDAPNEPDPMKPRPGSRVVQMFRIVGTRNLYGAVRRRSGVPASESFEAVSGYEKFGTRGQQLSQGYRWTNLLGVYPEASPAETALRERFGDHLKAIPYNG